jgi:photosystem II stability/assembly factor-like uncharacterized protein
MKIHFRNLLAAVLVCGSFLPAFSQEQYTPYDEIPGVIRSYKPSFSNDLPSWAKLLYRVPVNYNEITNQFDDYRKTHPGEESAIIRYYKIWSRAAEPYALADGTIVLPDLGKYYQDLLSVQKSAGSKMKSWQTTASDWTFLGPKETFWLNESGSATAPSSCPWQANVYSFDVAGSNSSILYCGTETGYVNKTINKGLTWNLLAQNYYFGGAVTAIAVHPTNPDLVYAAAGNQVHKTLDGGTSWLPLLPAGNQFYADRLRIDNSDPQKIFAASSSGLYVTTSAGSTWVRKWTDPVYDVEIKPNDNSRIFALSKTGGKFSVIISADGGQTFQVMAGFPTNVVESSGGLLAVTAASPDILLAILLSSNNTPYLLKGTLVSGSWNWALVATGQTGAFPMDNGQGYFDLVLDVSPNNASQILVGTTTLFKSLNGGTTFSAVGGYYGNFSIHPDIQDIRMLPNGETWVSTDGGMNLTTDNFGIADNYFVRINGLMGSDLWGFDQGWNEDIVVGGRYHNGNTALADFYQPKALRMGGAESPTGWMLQGKSRYAAFNDLGNGWILPATAEGMPEGRFIFSKYPNMDEYGGRRSNLVAHPNYYGTLFLGEGTGFWKSTDLGVTWDLLFDFPGRVRYLQISCSNPAVLYADIVGNGLYKSTDGGLSWTSKPSLTSPPNGNSNWNGKLFFAISPSDENRIYACLQNGTWSADLGKIFLSTNGGDTWTDWTGSLSEYLKCIVIQPDTAGNDLVYLFTNAIGGKEAKVFCRKAAAADWSEFDNNYPAGMAVNLALPFFRDGKLRVAGNGSIWESPLQEPEFKPRVNPWIEKAHYDCMTDTLYFEDHSILNHSGVRWHWTVTPAPAYFENADIRNPKVVLGNPGSYDVSLTVTQNGREYAKAIPAMVTASTCPSIYDCKNPGQLPKSEWRLIYADSEETNYPGLAGMSFDGDPSTIWHTRWSTGDDPYPHEIQVALGAMYKVSKFTYLTRQDGENGRIKDYELYISDDSLDWGVPARTGQFDNTGAPQSILFDTAKTGSFFRLVALSEINGNPWASAAEFSMTGCVDYPAGTGPLSHGNTIAAFPLPANGFVNISLPDEDRFHYKIISLTGQVVGSGEIINPSGSYAVFLGEIKAGVYFVVLTGSHGTQYRVKVVKK